MGLMDWSASLDIGVEEMNNQHKHLLKIMNDLFDASKAEDAEETHKLLNDLAAYTVKHFKEEEEYMESIDFPGFIVHKKIHEDLLAKFTVHMNEFHKTKKLDEQFFNFLKLWLSAHIQGIDAKYGEMANSK